MDDATRLIDYFSYSFSFPPSRLADKKGTRAAKEETPIRDGWRARWDSADVTL
jgi:hypothetical protein